MWQNDARPRSGIAQAAGDILYSLFLLVAVPIAALTFIAKAYLSLALFIAGPTEDPRRTGAGTDEARQS